MCFLPPLTFTLHSSHLSLKPAGVYVCDDARVENMGRLTIEFSGTFSSIVGFDDFCGDNQQNTRRSRRC